MENKSKVAFREATQNDIERIMELEKKSFDSGVCEKLHTYEERIEVFAKGFYLMEDSDGVEGYICSEIWEFKEDFTADDFILGHSAKDSHNWEGNELYISSMGIDPGIRGGGYGKLLFNSFLAYIKENFPKVTSVLLIVSEKWVNARKIYKSNDFIEIGTFKDFFAKGESGIVMRKEL